MLEYGLGDYFGELSLLSATPGTRKATVRASKKCVCLRLSVTDFQKLEQVQQKAGLMEQAAQQYAEKTKKILESQQKANKRFSIFGSL